MLSFILSLFSRKASPSTPRDTAPLSKVLPSCHSAPISLDTVSTETKHKEGGGGGSLTPVLIGQVAGDCLQVAINSPIPASDLDIGTEAQAQGSVVQFSNEYEGEAEVKEEKIVGEAKHVRSVEETIEEIDEIISDVSTRQTEHLSLQSIDGSGLVPLADNQETTLYPHSAVSSLGAQLLAVPSADSTQTFEISGGTVSPLPVIRKFSNSNNASKKLRQSWKVRVLSKIRTYRSICSKKVNSRAAVSDASKKPGRQSAKNRRKRENQKKDKSVLHVRTPLSDGEGEHEDSDVNSGLGKSVPSASQTLSADVAAHPPSESLATCSKNDSDSASLSALVAAKRLEVDQILNARSQACNRRQQLQEKKDKLKRLEEEVHTFEAHGDDLPKLLEKVSKVDSRKSGSEKQQRRRRRAEEIGRMIQAEEELQLVREEVQSAGFQSEFAKSRADQSEIISRWKQLDQDLTYLQVAWLEGVAIGGTIEEKKARRRRRYRSRKKIQARQAHLIQLLLSTARSTILGGAKAPSKRHEVSKPRASSRIKKSKGGDGGGGGTKQPPTRPEENLEAYRLVTLPTDVGIAAAIWNPSSESCLHPGSLSQRLARSQARSISRPLTAGTSKGDGNCGERSLLMTLTNLDDSSPEDFINLIRTNRNRVADLLARMFDDDWWSMINGLPWGKRVNEDPSQAEIDEEFKSRAKLENEGYEVHHSGTPSRTFVRSMEEHLDLVRKMGTWLDMPVLRGYATLFDVSPVVFSFSQSNLNRFYQTAYLRPDRSGLSQDECDALDRTNSFSETCTNKTPFLYHQGDHFTPTLRRDSGFMEPEELNRYMYNQSVFEELNLDQLVPFPSVNIVATNVPFDIPGTFDVDESSRSALHDFQIKDQAEAALIAHQKVLEEASRKKGLSATSPNVLKAGNLGIGDENAEYAASNNAGAGPSESGPSKPYPLRSSSRRSSRRSGTSSFDDEVTARSSLGNSLSSARAKKAKVGGISVEPFEEVNTRGEDLGSQIGFDGIDDMLAGCEELGDLEVPNEVPIPTDALLQAVSDFFVEEGLSATDAATVAKEFVALLQEERTTDENSIERSNSLNAIIQALSNKMADNVDPDNVAEWRRTSKPAWIGEDLVTNELPDWTKAIMPVIGHWAVDRNVKTCATIIDLIKTGRNGIGRFLFDVIPFRWAVRHTGESLHTKFFTGAGQEIPYEITGQVVSHCCEERIPFEMIGSPVAEFLRNAPGLIVRRLNVVVPWKGSRKLKYDKGWVRPEVYYVRKEGQKIGEGTLGFKFYHPSFFSARYSSRDHQLAQDATLELSNRFLPRGLGETFGRHFYENNYGSSSTISTPSSRSQIAAQKLNKVATLELKEDRCFSMAEIFQFEPLAYETVKRYLHFQSDEMEAKMSRNPRVPKHLQSSVVQAAKWVMSEYGQERRTVYWPAQRQKKKENLLSIEELVALEEKEASNAADRARNAFIKENQPEVYKAMRKAQNERYVFIREYEPEVHRAKLDAKMDRYAFTRDNDPDTHRAKLDAHNAADRDRYANTRDNKPEVHLARSVAHNARNVARHQAEKAAGVSYVCEGCKRAFSRKDTAQRHQRTKKATNCLNQPISRQVTHTSEPAGASSASQATLLLQSTSSVQTTAKQRPSPSRKRSAGNENHEDLSPSRTAKRTKPDCRETVSDTVLPQSLLPLYALMNIFPYSIDTLHCQPQPHKRDFSFSVRLPGVGFPSSPLIDFSPSIITLPSFATAPVSV